MTAPTRPSLPPELRETRFWEKVDMSGECWIWTGQRAPNGYGRVRVGDTSKPAHRIAYELCVGPVAQGLMVCHNCPGGDNKACVNPAHLWLGTNADNIRDAYEKGFTNNNARKETCKFGHELSGDNLYINPRGNRRVCLACQRRIDRESQKRRRAARKASETNHV